VVSFADRASARCTSSRRRAPDSRAETDMLGRAPKTDRAETYRRRTPLPYGLRVL
jgi:hypothetical protein